MFGGGLSGSYEARGYSVSDSSHRFLLKVWREPGAQPNWHATLRDVLDGSLHEFRATEALIDYLASLDQAADSDQHVEEESK